MAEPVAADKFPAGVSVVGVVDLLGGDTAVVAVIGYPDAPEQAAKQFKIAVEELRRG